MTVLDNSSPRARADALAEQVNPTRLLQVTMSLLEIPSPSGSERGVAERYAEVLRDSGLVVELDEEFPDSPTVIGRMTWQHPVARTLQFDGHTDTVAQPHPSPTFCDGQISGRGAADMKAGLAAMAEVARVIASSGARLAGNLLVTAHGQHEDPVPPNELHAPMFSLFNRGVVGDAAIIAEGPSHEMIVAGKGICVFDVTFQRDGEPVHEVYWRDRIANPIMGAHRFIQLLEERARGWAESPDPLLGPETYFVGVIHSGDYYNRIPTTCRLEGSRRYPAERTFEQVADELRGLATQVEHETGLRADMQLRPSGQGFRLDPREPIVQVVRQAYRETVDRELPLAGMSLIGNASQFNTIARVPTVYHGVDQATAHSGFEQVALEDVVRCARVLVRSAVHYLGVLD
jgi:acetylornithine deacetylase/succinyl-diaminopimelate desuccinylase-like protein